MSATASITIKKGKNYLSIYNHRNGSPDYLGRLLLNLYSKAKSQTKLLASNGMSVMNLDGTLEPLNHPKAPLSNPDWREDITLGYECDYNYLFAFGQWWLMQGAIGARTLAPLAQLVRP